MKDKIIYVVLVITLLVATYAFSWIVTCGIIKLITLCFGLTFTWKSATGIWIILCLVEEIFRVCVKK